MWPCCTDLQISLRSFLLSIFTSEILHSSPSDSLYHTDWLITSILFLHHSFTSFCLMLSLSVCLSLSCVWDLEVKRYLQGRVQLQALQLHLIHLLLHYLSHSPLTVSLSFNCLYWSLSLPFSLSVTLFICLSLSVCFSLSLCHSSFVCLSLFVFYFLCLSLYLSLSLSHAFSWPYLSVVFSLFLCLPLCCSFCLSSCSSLSFMLSLSVSLSLCLSV